MKSRFSHHILFLLYFFFIIALSSCSYNLEYCFEGNSSNKTENASHFITDPPYTFEDRDNEYHTSILIREETDKETEEYPLKEDT